MTWDSGSGERYASYPPFRLKEELRSTDKAIERASAQHTQMRIIEGPQGEDVRGLYALILRLGNDRGQIMQEMDYQEEQREQRRVDREQREIERQERRRAAEDRKAESANLAKERQARADEKRRRDEAQRRESQAATRKESRAVGQAERELPKSLNRELLLARAGGELEIWFLNMGLAIRPESPALQVSMQWTLDGKEYLGEFSPDTGQLQVWLKVPNGTQDASQRGQSCWLSANTREERSIALTFCFRDEL